MSSIKTRIATLTSAVIDRRENELKARVQEAAGRLTPEQRERFIAIKEAIDDGTSPELWATADEAIEAVFKAMIALTRFWLKKRGVTLPERLQAHGDRTS